jgi:purine-nucleoside phosphorylase
MVDLNFKYKTLIDFLKSESPFIPELSIILGSGLGDFADQLKIRKSISTSDIPGYPVSTVVGHKGKIHFAEYENKKVILFQGRVHFYEGYNINECIIPVFISHKLGVKNLLLTNAAGGINKYFVPGDLMLTTSFNGILIKKELTDLIGLTNQTAKSNFIYLPDPELNSIIKKSALDEKINIKEGVYWYTKGPTYETPAEIKILCKIRCRCSWNVHCSRSSLFILPWNENSSNILYYKFCRRNINTKTFSLRSNRNSRQS